MAVHMLGPAMKCQQRPHSPQPANALKSRRLHMEGTSGGWSNNPGWNKVQEIGSIFAFTIPTGSYLDVGRETKLNQKLKKGGAELFIT